ncbi:DNA/RNA helicase domain-containing protein [Kineococcus sp. LSe6-4]|uniref:DNA/RNA helicase domain-containing protein n=1 Tax=Kineococcus halophytocola TaxID=3234027 RepID=A0ABV4H3S6_9ACTN
MSLVRRTAAQLQDELPSGSVVETLMEQLFHTAGHGPSPSEVASWRASLPVLVTDLVVAGLGDVEVLLEHSLPLTSKRADVVLAGVHPTTGNPSYVVVELKQWSSAHRFEGNPDLVVVPGMPGPPKLHPVRQVRGYVDYLLDFTRALEFAPEAVAGVAYLHNATRPGAVADLQDYEMSRSGRLFTGADRDAFQSYLCSRLAPGTSGGPAADELLGSKVAPSRQLLAVAADEIRDRERFHLVGEQQEAVDLVVHQVKQAKAGNGKRIIVVTGGPGSGKSVIALSLLGELSRKGSAVLHATGSKSFTQTLRKVAGYRSRRVQSMFKYFNQFTTAEPNDLDVLILDEAHRIRETSVDRYTRAELRTGRPQIDELIAAARVPVFLLDQHQVVRPGELGSLEEISRHAERLGLDVVTVPLDAQFRCGGSAEYVRWVQRLLGLDDTGPRDWAGDEKFEVVVASSPHEMEAFLAAKRTEGYSARMSAGYCWPWSDPTPEGTLRTDVVIGDWERPWNVKGDRPVGEAPAAALWATQDGGFGQVGCVYTAQGFEYDWSGVIIGPDLVWRDGGFRSVRAANRDPDFRSAKKVSDAEFDRLVRNVYKVLLTRGMVGTVLYSTDEETRERLEAMTAGRHAPE